MALQDLTPQLRTRLRKVEWIVMLFLFGTAALALAGFAWFIKTTGDKQGWWITQVPYYTYLSDAGSIKKGTPVKMLGFTVGEVVFLDMAEDSEWNRSQGFNVFVRMLVRRPYFDWVHTDSYVKIGGMPIDIAGGTFLEITRADGTGIPTVTNSLSDTDIKVLGDKYAYQVGKPDATNHIRYVAFTKEDKGYFLKTEPAGDLIGELTALIPKIRESFSKPGGLGDLLIPTNLAARFDKPGGLGELVIPVELNAELTKTLTNLNAQIGGVGSLVSNLDATVPPLLTNLNATLPPLLTNLDATVPPLLTNLNAQIGGVGSLVSNLDHSLPGVLTQADLTLGTLRSNTLPAADVLLNNTGEFIGGLKRHWLFRGAFKTNAPAKKK